ncbi:sensor histidine kinase [Paenibacillus piri]|uniref:histidine kinase n=1 Tax=Paenibacillus piri TaxID=2547395 RepID=A0A4R5KA34_9BACL|nr:ATP-binding protein [Paenibacillus piri]TDF91308.1 HAMP domain-containing protein [Paenibacillus piri]
MNVRGKLFGAMAVLVLFVTVFYFGTTQGYLESRFEHYSKDKTSGIFETYYKDHGNSWEGIERMKISNGMGQGSPDQREISLLSTDGDILFFKGVGDPQSLIQHGKQKLIKINEIPVGTIFVDRWESTEAHELKIYVLDSMLTEGFIVPALTGVIALLLGLWLIRRLTLPLKRLIPAIEKMAHGNLHIQIPVSTKDEYGKVTEALNHMAKQLMRAEEVRKHLTADVAHELRTPLSIIQCQMENIQVGGRDVPPEILLPMQDEVIRLSKLVDDLHQLTLAEAGKLPLDRKPADLVLLLNRIIDMLKPEAEDRKIEMICSYQASTMIVFLDPNRITQVLYNLLTNALRYTPHGGNITIRLTNSFHEGSRFAVVSVADTGAGIAAEQLPYLFDRFYRVEEARSRHTGGMGLGLAIAKEFVEAHQGCITVASEVGQGTSFTVYLPFSSDSKPVHDLS